MGLKRRTFLQQAALGMFTLSAGALVPAQTQKISRRYWQTLAETTNRKLALLVGINNYPRQPLLRGCVTDVELQQELLIHRFGFDPADILVLTNQAATSDNIKTAFDEHLIKQAQASDVVVFHFSGYGSQIQINSDKQTNAPLVNYIVPVDGMATQPNQSGSSYLLESELLQWANSLKTERVTLVLDAGYKPSQPIGNLRSRSLSDSKGLTTKELKTQPPGRKKQSQKLSFGTLLLGSSGDDGTANEIQWNEFSAGVFTYALTQYLWQVMPASRLMVAYTRTAQHMAEIVGKQQRPSLQGKNQSLYTYYLLPNIPGAEGVVTAVDSSNNVQVKLVGLPPQVLASYSPNACFKLVNDSSQSSAAYLQIRSVEGLRAKAQWIDTEAQFEPAVGQLVQEWIRVLPRNLGLTVALDQNLDRIERVDATSAFASLKNLATIVNSSEQAAEYLFARVDPNDNKFIKATNESITSSQGGGYALFAQSGSKIGKAIVDTNEAVKSAVERLRGQLSYLLSLKLLHLTENETASGLSTQIVIDQLEAAVGSGGKTSVSKAIAKQQTGRNAGTIAAQGGQSSSSAIAAVAAGSKIGVQITNYNDFPIYPLLLSFDSNQNLALFCPPSLKDQQALDAIALARSLEIAPDQTLNLADSQSFNWVVSGPPGLAEAIIISSTMPFKRTFAAVLEVIGTKTDQPQLVALSQPLPVVRAIMNDLHDGSRVDSNLINSSTDVYALNVDRWSGISWVYEVVKS